MARYIDADKLIHELGDCTLDTCSEKGLSSEKVSMLGGTIHD